MKNFFKKLIFILAAVIAPFLAANEILRWTWFRNYPLMRITKWDTQLIHCLKPNFNGRMPIGVVTGDAWKGKNAFWQMTTNAQQIRSAEEIKPKTPGVFRIICLGDSVTMGLEVDDRYTYPAQLQQVLNRSLNGRAKVEVINAGVWGFSSRQGLVYLDQGIMKYQPDLVVLEFGINDARKALLSVYSDKDIIKGDVKKGWKKLYYSPLGAIFLVIYEQPLMIFMKNLIHTLKVASLMKNLAQMDKEQIKKQAATRKNTDADLYKNVRVPPKDLLENYLQFIYLSRRNGFALMFYVPFQIPTVFRDQLVGLAHDYKIPALDFSRRFDNPRFQDLTENPEYNRLLAYYREKLGDDFLKKQPRFLVSTDNGIHLNAVGNRIVAEEMAKYISEIYFPASSGN